MTFIKQNQTRNSRLNGETGRIDWTYSLENKAEKIDEFDFILNEYAHKLVRRNLSRQIKAIIKANEQSDLIEEFINAS